MNDFSLPDNFAGQYGPWALIAGGSEGVGESFARQLAGAGIHLVLLARRQGPLDRLASSISEDHGVAVRTLTVDLTRPELLSRVRALTDDIEVGLMIYNAGSNIAYNRFPDWEPEQLEYMIALNCTGANTTGASL